MIPAFLSAAALVLAGPARIPPQDECKKDASLAAYRQELTAAVKARDAERLLPLLADDIAFTFGDVSGRAAFARDWKLDRAERSELWAELDKVLRLGCALDGKRAEAPWLYARLPDAFDPFEYVVAIRPGATAHAAPNARSKVLARLNWDILLGGADAGAGWIAVTFADKRRAFVRLEDVRSPIDYRAAFEHRNGRWKMVMFIAGD